MEHTNVVLFQKENEILMEMVRDLRREVRELKMTKSEKEEDFAEIRADLEVKLNVSAFGNLIKMRFSTIARESHEKVKTEEFEESKTKSEQVQKEGEVVNEKLLTEDDNASDNNLGRDEEVSKETDQAMNYLKEETFENESDAERENTEKEESTGEGEIDNDNDQKETEKNEASFRKCENETDSGNRKSTKLQFKNISKLVTLSDLLTGSKISEATEESSQLSSNQMKPEIKVELNIDLEEREVEKKVAADEEEEEEGGSDLPSVEDLCNKYRNVIEKYKAEDSSNQEGKNNHSYDSKIQKSKTFENFENLFSQFRSSVESDTVCGEKPMGNIGEKPEGWNIGEEPVGSSSWVRQCKGELLGTEGEAALSRGGGGEGPAKKRKRQQVGFFHFHFHLQQVCGKCAACLRTDCDSCRNCLDKPRNGGENTRKQKCLLRKCSP